MDAYFTRWLEECVPSTGDTTTSGTTTASAPEAPASLSDRARRLYRDQEARLSASYREVADWLHDRLPLAS